MLLVVSHFRNTRIFCKGPLWPVVVNAVEALPRFTLQPSEAIFFKPLDDIEALHEALERAFQKNDHWWAALQELSHRKQCTSVADSVECHVE